MGFVEHDEGVVGDGVDGEGFDFGEGMSEGSDEEEFLFEEGFDFDVFGGDGESDDGEVDVAMGAAFDEGVGGVFLDDDGDFGVFFGEAAEEAGEEVGGDGGDGAEADAAFAARFGEFGEGVFDELEDFFGAAEEELAVVGKDDFAGFAFEERLAELVLEFLDGAGEGGLGEIEFEGGVGEVFGAGEDDELLEGVEVEVVLHGGA